MATHTTDGEKQVAAFLTNLIHPLKKEIEVVRKLILASDKNITEHIKWNAPSFCYKGDDRITFNLHGKDFFRLIFHCGAKVKDNKQKSRLFEDPTALLDWITNDRAIVKFTDMEDVKLKKTALITIIHTWLKCT